MEREITKRRQVIELLGQGKKYYDRYSWTSGRNIEYAFFSLEQYTQLNIFSLYGEAEIVATAYSNFGQRVKKVRSFYFTLRR